MTLTPYQIAVRNMASHVESINMMLRTKDISQAKAKLMLCEAAQEVRQHAPSDVIIKYGIHKGLAWASVS